MKQAILIKPKESGMTVVTVIPFETGSLDFYYKELECDCIDIVHAYGLSVPADIIVDDEGLFAEEPKTNLPASIAYGVLEHGQPIVGNALICGYKETRNGVVEVGFELEDIQKILTEIHTKMKGVKE